MYLKTYRRLESRSEMSLQISPVEAIARMNSGTESVTLSLVALPPRHIYTSFLQSFI